MRHARSDVRRILLVRQSRGQCNAPSLPVQNAQGHGFGQMRQFQGQGFAAARPHGFQIRNGARQTQHPRIGPRRKSQTLHSAFQQGGAPFPPCCQAFPVGGDKALPVRVSAGLFGSEFVAHAYVADCGALQVGGSPWQIVFIGVTGRLPSRAQIRFPVSCRYSGRILYLCIHIY